MGGGRPGSRGGLSGPPPSHGVGSGQPSSDAASGAPPLFRGAYGSHPAGGGVGGGRPAGGQSYSRGGVSYGQTPRAGQQEGQPDGGSAVGGRQGSDGVSRRSTPFTPASSSLPPQVPPSPPLPPPPPPPTSTFFRPPSPPPPGLSTSRIRRQPTQWWRAEPEADTQDPMDCDFAPVHRPASKRPRSLAADSVSKGVPL